MKTTIRDIARLADVSETTVSLAFRPKSRISNITRQKILRIALQLKYMPNEAARNLRHGGMKVLAIVVNDITNPFYAQMFRMVEMTAQAEGFQVTVLESQWKSDRELVAINRVLQTRVQGVLICQCERTGESLKLLGRYGVPYVALDTYPLDYNGPYVANDLVASGKLAAEHLSTAGYKNPIMIVPKSGRKYFSSFARLIEGFSKVMKSRGIPFGPDHIFNAGLAIEDGLNTLPCVLKQFPKVDAIICPNDLCALGVIEAIDKKGRKVGQDIGVIGIDDLTVSGLTRISLTSIRQPYKEISELATKLLINSIQSGTPVSVRKTMLPMLMPRESTNRNPKY